MIRSRDIVAAAGVVLFVAALMSLATAQPHGREIIYPRQTLPLRFSHALHLGDGGAMSCEQCHNKIRQSASSLDNNMPQEAQCKGCHAIDRQQPELQTSGPSARCITCHPQFDAMSGQVRRMQMPIPNLKFSHRAHLDRKTSCATCHGDVSTLELATEAQLPSMRTCQGCHDGTVAPNTCITCHLSQVGGTMQSEFPGLGSLRPSGSLRGAAHTLEFRTTHKYAAQNDEGFCASCHKKDFCVECHNGSVKPMDFHGGDYVRMHAIEARRNSPDCSGCHRVQTFCQGCHSRMGVADDEKGGQFGGTGRFHPAGWTESGLAGRGPGHHAFEAQRNIKQCASCHRESDCTKCHSAQIGSPRANPHPRNWRGSRRCEALVKRNKRMCLRCHVDANVGC